MFEDVLRFWLDRGVDGFRIDVAHGLYKVESLPNQKDPTVRRIERMLDSAYGEDEPTTRISNRGTWILERHDGEWLIVLEHVSFAIPAPYPTR